MITVPLYAFLFLFFIFLACIAIFFIVDVYHIFASASFTIVSFTMTFFVILISALTLLSTVNLLSGVDWTTPVTLFDPHWIRSVLNPGVTTL